VQRLIDLSHSVADGQVTYPGIPAPIICDFLSREASKAHYAEGVSFCINQISMPANTGTYIDSPFHRYAHGADLAEMPLESVAQLDAIVCRAKATGRAIDADVFKGRDVTGKAVLIETGWSKHWGTPEYFNHHPFLTRSAAEYLKNHGAVLVGIDSLNIDDMADLERPVHSILLGENIPIVEHMTGLDLLPDSGFLFSAAPVKVEKFGTFPVRAYAVIET
jgi:arylformamidase